MGNHNYGLDGYDFSGLAEDAAVHYDEWDFSDDDTADADYYIQELIETLKALQIQYKYEHTKNVGTLILHAMVMLTYLRNENTNS